MALPSATLAASSALVALIGVAACTPKEAGYVEIKTVPVTAAAAAALYLDSVKLEPVKNGTAVLRQGVGTLKLAADGGGGKLAPLCEIVVRKNRITTVTVSVLDRPPRCMCRNSASDGSGGRSCVG
jgi:hypothetical protein